MNNTYKFAVIIRQEKILDSICADKKTKQRYLDYAYKRGLKNALQQLINNQIINDYDVRRILCFSDEHTTATNGRYELEESLEMEFKRGVHNYNYTSYYPALFKSLESVTVDYCNSANKTLVRAADIVANKIYYYVTTNQITRLKSTKNLFYIFLPEIRD
ncbi:hypothetical protein SAMN06297422_10691 [Lachnospiraceae bacterium]|nr:hypothetical protein SAMN06297422_10691 [Lachnospiraceae bacterium]